MENLTVAGLIAVIAAILGIAGTYVSMKRGIKADAVAEGKNDGVVLNEIAHIQSGIDDIKKEQARTSEQMINFVRELAIMQRSLEAEHSRIDRNETRIDSLEREVRK